MWGTPVYMPINSAQSTKAEKIRFSRLGRRITAPPPMTVGVTIGAEAVCRDIHCAG